MQRTHFENLVLSDRQFISGLDAFVQAVESQGVLTPQMYELGRKQGYLTGSHLGAFESLDNEIIAAREGVMDALSGALAKVVSHVGSILGRFSKKSKEGQARAAAAAKSGFMGFGKPKTYKIVNPEQTKAIIHTLTECNKLCSDVLKAMSDPSKFTKEEHELAFEKAFVSRFNAIKWPWGGVVISVTSDTVSTKSHGDVLAHDVTLTLEKKTLEEHGWTKETAAQAARTCVDLYRSIDSFLDEYDQKIVVRARAMDKEQAKYYIRTLTTATTILSCIYRAYTSNAIQLLDNVWLAVK